MTNQPAHWEARLNELQRVVKCAVAFFLDADETLADDHQTAREVLSHLVFWHREYLCVIHALAEGQQPNLRRGTFREFNALAAQEFKAQSLPALARRLAKLQRQLHRALRKLPDHTVDFPLKQGGCYWSVQTRIPTITAHIHNHVKRLKQVATNQEK